MADTVYNAPAERVSAGETTTPHEDRSYYSVKDEKKLSGDYNRVVSTGEWAEDEPDLKTVTWPRMALLLIVEAIALGALSLPGAFAAVGLPAGVVLTVGIGLITIYTSYLVGQVCNGKWDIEVLHYSDIGYLMWGKWGREIVGGGFVLFLVLVTGSHALTGAIALDTIADGRACKLVWSIVSAVVLWLLSLPTTFEKVSFLGIADFISIIAAILITMIATGIRAHNSPGGLDGVDWRTTAPPHTKFSDAFNAVTDIVFAYSFAVCQPSFQAEMRKPEEYMKSIWALGLAEIFIYTLTGSLVYVFVGQDVQSPALLSAGHTVSRVAFGVAIPVIYISGAINTTTAARYIHLRAFKNSPHRYINTTFGIATWVALCAVLTVISWAIAEAIPFFSSLLSVISSFLISAFTLYLPPLMYFYLLQDGKWNKNKKNIFLAVANLFLVAMGLAVLGIGMWAAAESIKEGYNEGTVGRPFECKWGVRAA